MANPTGNPSSAAGPLGVRRLPGNQILATFGTGEVGVIDVATKRRVWQTVAYTDKVERRDVAGNVQGGFSQLSDGSKLDFPYGIQVVDYPG